MHLQDLLTRLEGVKGQEPQWTAHCPCKGNHKHGDKNRSLSIGLNGTKILLHCQTGCTTDEICAAIGISTSDLFTDAPQSTERTVDEKRRSFLEWYAGQNGLRLVSVYSYCYGEHADGLAKVRYLDADGGKTFRWIHDDPTTPSGFKLNHEGCAHRLYIAGDPDAAEAFVVEGEKDADKLHSITGKTVVSAENGAQRSNAGGNKWLPEYTDQLAGKTVVILHDNDEAGRTFAHLEADAIATKAASVRVLDIATAWTECPDKGDVSDMVAALGKQDTLTRLQNLLCNAVEWRTTLQIPTEAPTPTNEQTPVETPVNAATMDSVGAFDDFMGKVQTEAYKPIKTGMTDFDRLLGGGIMKQSLVILSAAPGTGKTTLAQQIFERMAHDGNDVVFLNLEMSREQLLARSVSRIIKRNGGALTASGILQGYSWTDEQRRQAIQAANEYRETIAPRMHYNPDGCTADLQAIKGALNREADAAKKAGRKPPVVVLDYLHLVTTGQREEQSEIIKKTVKALKDYAIRYDTFVFAISATNRTSNQRGTISLESGRDSSALEYTADVALSLNYAALHDKTKLPMPRKDDDGNVIPGSTEYQTADANNPDHMEYLQKQQPRQMLVQVLKNRMNEPGGKLYLAFDAAHSRFTPIDRHTEAPTTWTTLPDNYPTPFTDKKYTI